MLENEKSKSLLQVHIILIPCNTILNCTFLFYDINIFAFLPPSLSPFLSSERCLEDHELVVQVQASMSSDSRFLFRKNYAKYEFFRNPLVMACCNFFSSFLQHQLV